MKDIANAIAVIFLEMKFSSVTDRNFFIRVIYAVPVISVPDVAVPLVAFVMCSVTEVTDLLVSVRSFNSINVSIFAISEFPSFDPEVICAEFAVVFTSSLMDA